jgi:FtsP/CotA-like multicopper oxidase with cupredoxin domain
MPTRRDFLKVSTATGAVLYVNLVGGLSRAGAVPAAVGLSDPALQPKFANPVPNALDPGFVYRSKKNKYKIAMTQIQQTTGLIDPTTSSPLTTTVWGYGENGPGGTWPGRTFEVRSGEPVEVTWQNKLPMGHPLPVDTSLHWAYSLAGYEQYSLENDGPPVVTHLHGGHSDAIFDGNPEYFFSPGYTVRGPRWVGKKYVYQNDQPAGTGDPVNAIGAARGTFDVRGL